MTPENWNGLAGVTITLLTILLGIAARRLQQSAVVRRDVESFQTSNDNLREELRAVQRELDDKTRASQERDRRIDQMAEQIRLTESTAREVERTNANLQGRLTEQREIFTRQLSDQTNQIVQLTVTLAQRNDELSELKQSQTSKEAASQQDKETIARLETELNSEREERRALAVRVLALEKQVDAMLEERARLIKERDDAIAERDEAIRVKQELQRQLAERDETIRLLSVSKPEVVRELAQSVPPVESTPA